MDDDFNTGILDSKWIVVEGSEGTVDLLATSRTTALYDVDTVDDCLAIQMENNRVSLRQDYELPDGKSVIMKLHPSVNASSNEAYEAVIGLSLNTSDASPDGVTTNGFMRHLFESTADGWRIFGQHKTSAGTTNDSTAISDPGDECNFNGGTVYLRIARSGNSYFWFASFDGIAWVPMKQAVTPPAVYTNIWIHAYSALVTGSKVLPIQLIDWVKEIDNTVFDVR